MAVLRLCLAVLFTSLACVAGAGYQERPEARELIKQLEEQGLDGARLRQLLGQAERKESILEAIARPAEKVLDWGEYRQIFVQPTRIRQGVAFYREHEALLARAEKEYGVSRFIILAILGVETRYGRHKGSYRVLDALATLGFDYPPRATFFRRQLQEFFLMEKEAGIDAASMTGSYAGAIGYPQFIPSSYRAYAVDFDGDGKTDLVNSLADAIGSVASYFKQHRWQTGLPVAARARVDGDDYQQYFQRQMKPTMTLAELAKKGASPLSCDNGELPSAYCFDLPGETRVVPLRLETTQGTEFWLGTENFYVITRYNHSPLYAMAVFQLSRELEQRIGNEK